MRWISFKQPRLMHQKVVHPGYYYLMTTAAVDFLYTIPKEQGLILATKECNLPMYDGSQDLAGKKICFVRTGGWGDLVSQSPLWRWVKKTYPSATIGLACAPGYVQTFVSQPEITQSYLHDSPILEQVAMRYDYICCFENSVEKSKDPDLHIVDIMAKSAGIHLAEDEKTISYTLVRESVARIADLFDNRKGPFHNDKSKLKVAIQWRSSAPQRSFPETKMTQVLTALAALPNVAIYVLGGIGECKWAFPPSYHTWNLCGKLSLENSLALLARMDVLLAPDSSLLHAAGALGIPSVGIFGGPIPSKVRRFISSNGSGPKQVLLDVNYRCAPCFLHGHKLCLEAKKQGKDYSPCFDTITSQQVFNAAMGILGFGHASTKTQRQWALGLKRMGIDPMRAQLSVSEQQLENVKTEEVIEVQEPSADVFEIDPTQLHEPTND